jgi:hypothetical protein
LEETTRNQDDDDKAKGVIEWQPDDGTVSGTWTQQVPDIDFGTHTAWGWCATEKKGWANLRPYLAT